MKKVEIRFTGIGGQGIILSSVILGRAASIYDNKNAIQNQTYGSDIRGGYVCAELIISVDKIIYPVVNNPNILIALSQEGYNNNVNDIANKGILITDSDLVNALLLKGIIHYNDSFNRIALEDFKNKEVANMILLGFLQEKTKIISYSALKKAIRDLVPFRTLKLNFKALERGKNIAK